MGKSYDVQVNGVDAVLARFDRVSGESLAQAAQHGMDEWGIIIADDGKERAPYRTGKLRRAIHTEPLGNGVGVRVVVPPIEGVPYGFYQHEGTGVYGPRAAPIVPTNAKFLRFSVRNMRVSKTGRARTQSSVVFAKSVRGVPSNPFLLDAFYATIEDGKSALAESISASARGEGA